MRDFLDYWEKSYETEPQPKIKKSTTKWEYDRKNKVMPIKPETTSNTVIIHYTYTIRNTKVETKTLEARPVALLAVMKKRKNYGVKIKHHC
jgi:hypothetical protein